MSGGSGGSNAQGQQASTFTRNFVEVHRAELKRIDRWRAKTGRPPLSNWPEDERAPIETTGVAISGGGIRSAAFALGALQALDQDLPDHGSGRGGLACIDYLSTVSGGGYIGASVSVGMDALDGRFPFSSGDDDKSDNLAVGHIRNHSRYLIPGGFSDVVGCVTVIVRGLVVNLAFVLAALLVCAGVTGLCNPSLVAFATPDFFGLEGFPYPPLILALGAFAYTKLLLAIGAVLFLAWAFARSLWADGSAEFQGPAYRLAWGWMVVTACMAVLELQPFAIVGLFYGTASPIQDAGPIAVLVAMVTAWVSKATAVLAPLVAASAMLSKLLGDTLKTARTDRSRAAWVRAGVARATQIAMALALPTVIWICFLELTILTDMNNTHRPGWLAEAVGWVCGKPDIGLVKPEAAAGACSDKHLVAWLFLATGGALFCLTWMLTPNANSLHRLYRDRLGKAFLFDPRGARTALTNEQALDSRALANKQALDPPSLATQTFADLNADNGPLHLINAALNVQGSKAVNRRGRNADFFFLSPAYIGSTSTGFLRTAAEQSTVSIPDIGTAMAISGAAVSSNMGSNTVRGLAPTLALLNIRLGYWMTNPALLDPEFRKNRTLWNQVKAALGFYLVEEMFSMLDERSAGIYLSDGGHIENLGLYELLRRRCRLIVVIDAEADPHMTFASLVQAERFARIDLGIRIELPWPAIRDASLAIDAAVADGKPIDGPAVDGSAGKSQPHIAIGKIEYEDGEGTLVYAKASLTGDENDYILDYKKRNPTFPHESTGDQFFSEEQFEVYRALGFHALHGALKGKAHVEGLKASSGFAIFGNAAGSAEAKAQTLAALFG